MRLDIVIPVYNEGESVLPWLEQVVSYLKAGDRLIVVDASDALTTGDSILQNNRIFQQDNVFYLTSDKGRALQMNAGAEFLLSRMRDDKSGLSLVWFLHSDSGLSNKHCSYLRALSSDVIWGRFDVQLNPDRFPFGIISKFINLRSRITQVMTGDQGIFIRSDIFQQLQGYADVPLMEDVEISKRLRILGGAECAGPILKTSARRWQKDGWVKTVLLMWQLRLLYWLGVSPRKLVKKYYG
tara:strand:+ start:665 stop:1384 length:720 start_codon:yes stop_codon:yes gene_type:complete